MKLRQTSDWNDFVRGRCLRELLGRSRPEEAPSRVLGSPDGQHLFLLWNEPASQARILAFQRQGTEGGSDLERSWQPPQPPLVGLLFLESPASALAWVLVIVWEQGKTELWRFAPALGWRLLQSLELCHGVRARIVSVCSWGSQLVWCEERPPLDTHMTAERRAFRYCVCTRDLQVGEQGAQLSPLRIVLHNSPPFQVLAVSSGVFMVPTAATFPSMAKFVLIWHPEDAVIVTAAPSRGSCCTQTSHSSGGVDFKKLVLGFVGRSESMDTLDIRHCALSSCGGLLLVSAPGMVELVQPDGLWRPVFDFGESAVAPGQRIQLKVLGDSLVCLLGGMLYLVDIYTKQLIEKKVLNPEVVFLDFGVEAGKEVHLVTPDGLYSLDIGGTTSGSHLEPMLMEMVFEEACKYYQRRSLSSSPLTVEKLKKGDMFQAPIALSSILGYSLSSKEKPPRGLPEPYAKLLGTMQLELQSYQDLESLKTSVVVASESEMESYSEALVEQEFNRLLHLDLNRENLGYLNAIFTSFPQASWKAIQNHLQLQQNGDGMLIARATPSIWKKILGGSVPSLNKKEEGPLNGVVPLFELVCLSFYHFKPKWLPPFVELSQQYMSASWTYSNKEGPDIGIPLYKRALAVLPKRRRCSVADGELEIELLLCSQRPKAILQAVDLLIQHGRWQRVMEVAEKFSMMSPLLNKEIFVILLREFTQHRALDSYLEKIWELCPKDLGASDILSIIHQHITPVELSPLPFPPDGSSQLTVGLLKPLLQRLTLCHSGQDEIYIGVQQSPTFPPPTPPRQHKVAVKAGASSDDLTCFQNHT